MATHLTSPFIYRVDDYIPRNTEINEATHLPLNSRNCYSVGHYAFQVLP